MVEKIPVPEPFDRRIAAFAAHRNESGQPWIAVGSNWTYYPKACWPCFTERLRRNGWTDRRQGHTPPATDPPPGYLLTTSSPRKHYVAPLPNCLRCKSLPGFRTPDDWISPLTGIIRSIKVEQTWPSYWTATAELSQVIYPLLDGRWFRGNRQMVHAHGLTAAQARQSCLYEAAERYSLQWHADEELVTARYKDLRSRAVHQDAYHLHSAGQFANRDVWRRTHGAFQWVPEPFDPSAEIPWVKVHRLWGRAARLVPAEMCFLGIPGRFLYADTNGCASGATEADALRNALYELAERDAVALWWYNRARRPAVRVDHPARRIMERAKRKFWMLDLTHDLGIPVVVAVSTDSQGGRIALGSAAGASLEAAAAKAAGEMLMVYSGLRYSAPEQWAQGTNEGTLCRWFRDARVAQRTYLLPARRRRLPAMNGAERRVDGWVKRHTRSDVGAHVIRVIAPGLRHWWARFAPGRLYEIPPAIGWTSRQLSEAELNPEPYLL